MTIKPRLDELTVQLPDEILPIANQLMDTVRDVFSDALTTTFLAGAFIMLIGVIAAIFVRSFPLVSANDNKQQAQGAE